MNHKQQHAGTTCVNGVSQAISAAQNIKGIERFNPNNLETLIECVDQQICGAQPYDRDVNLNVLKLYQFFPNLLDLNVAGRIVLLTITQMPRPDFTLAKFLIDTSLLPPVIPATQPPSTPESAGGEELNLPAQPANFSLLHIALELGDLLDQCQFEQFWKLLRCSPLPDEVLPLVRSIRDFTACIRNFIGFSVDSTFERVPKPLLRSYFGFDFSVEENDVNETENEFQDWIRKWNWKLLDGGEFVFVKERQLQQQQQQQTILKASSDGSSGMGGVGGGGGGGNRRGASQRTGGGGGSGGGRRNK